MDWITALYEYDGSFQGLLCCVFDSYTRKERPLSIVCGTQEQTTLEPIHQVITDSSHARRISDSIRTRAPKAMPFIKRSFLTCLPEKELHIYRLICKLYEDGPAFLRNPTDPAVYPLCTALRHMSAELEKLRGFVRFSEFDGVYAAEIEPKNRVLPALRGHFCARFADQPFLIYDRTHKEVLLHAGGTWQISPLDSFTMARPDQKEALYRSLWKTFFDTIAIQSRSNRRCQMNQLPLRYRATMTEFQGEDFFKAREESSLPAPPQFPSISHADEQP